MAQSDYDKMLESLYDHTVPVISTEDLHEVVGDQEVVILDTRSWEEYNVSHIKNAQYVGYKNFNIKAVDPDLKNMKVVVYCSVGYRSEKIGEQLKEAGYSTVYNLYGGIFQWVNKGNTVVNNKDIPTDSVHAYNRLWSKWLKKGTKVYE